MIANLKSLGTSLSEAGFVRDHDDEWFSLEQLRVGAEDVGGMLVKSAHMRKVLKTITRLGPYKATVLVHGESGTGKELVARALHTLGPVPKGPFVTFNCSNLVESLAEAQLFGHVRGAFTDAREDALGYFRSANGGTLFLDEIGELPLRLQPKLLRAVETHEVQPVGSAQSYKVDIRLIAATNRDLRAMVKAGQFRDDLYYRLTATTIVIPPLRERRDALDALAAHFIEHYNRLFGKQINAISRRALAALRAYEWPGNVREFAHAIQSAVMLTDNDRINLQSLPEHLVHGWHEGDEAAGLGAIETNSSIADEMDPRMPSPSGPAAEDETRGPFLLDEVIKRTLVRSLEETDGNRRRAADLLGISRSTLYRMLSRYGLAEEGSRRRSSIPIASPGSRPSRP
jgi:DNA-binding NtrC family response regulator